MHNNSIYKVIELLEGEVLASLENCEDLPQPEIDRIKEGVEELIDEINVTIDECGDDEISCASENSEDGTD